MFNHIRAVFVVHHYLHICIGIQLSSQALGQLLLETFISVTEFDHIGDQKLDLALFIVSRKDLEKVCDRCGVPFQNPGEKKR